MIADRRLPPGAAFRFLHRHRFTLGWLVPAWLLLGLARACIVAVPVHRLGPALGRRQSLAPRSLLLTSRQETRGERIGHVVRLAARHTPWTSNCFAQALAARVLLALHGVPHLVFFGLRRDPAAAAASAHAWVMAGRIAVTGGSGFAGFTVVGIFGGAGEAACESRANT